jgi:hypothetical protein
MNTSAATQLRLGRGAGRRRASAVAARRAAAGCAATVHQVGVVSQAGHAWKHPAPSRAFQAVTDRSGVSC